MLLSDKQVKGGCGMRKLLYALSVLNLLDGVLTWLGYINDIVLELNPLMNHLLEINPWYFLTFKAAFSAILYTLGVISVKYTLSNWVFWAFRIILAVYILLIILHLHWIVFFLVWFFGYS